MPALLVPAVAAATLLALAGALKVLDPTMTVGALRAIGLPASDGTVRALAGGEVLLGVAALTSSSPLPFLLAACSYLAFAAFVGAALRRGTMIGSCGCFGREDTPPHWSHLVLNVGLAAVSAQAVTFGAAPLDLLAERPGDGLVLVGFAALLVALLHAAYVDLPRTLAEVAKASASRRGSQLS